MVSLTTPSSSNAPASTLAISNSSTTGRSESGQSTSTDELVSKRAQKMSPAAMAKAAGLRYVSDQQAGYRRRRSGRGFTYYDWTGKVVRDPKLRERFTQLVIPPAWNDVWICRQENGHILATGRDEA